MGVPRGRAQPPISGGFWRVPTRIGAPPLLRVRVGAVARDRSRVVLDVTSGARYRLEVTPDGRISVIVAAPERAAGNCVFAPRCKPMD